MTLHPGVLRGHHAPTAARFGPDTGHDIPVRRRVHPRRCGHLLERFGTAAGLPPGAVHPRRDHVLARDRPAGRLLPERVRRRAVVVPRRPRGDPPLPRRGHRDRRLHPHLRASSTTPARSARSRPATTCRAGWTAATSPSWSPTHRLDEDEAVETAYDLVARQPDAGVQAVSADRGPRRRLTAASRRPARRAGAARAPRAGQLLPRPRRLVHRARRRRRRLGLVGLHRSPRRRRPASRQDGLYTLLERGPDGDRSEVVSALSRVRRLRPTSTAWREAFALPDLAVVTLTVTEAAYCRAGDGGLDLADPDVLADRRALRADGAEAEVTTVPGKLAARPAAPPRARAGRDQPGPVRQPARQRRDAPAGAARPGRPASTPTCSSWIDDEGRLREHDGRPDHAAHRAGRPRRPARHERRGRPRVRRHRAVHRVGAQRRLRRRTPELGVGGCPVRRRRRRRGAAQALAAQRRPLAAGVRRQHPRRRDRRRGDRRPRRPRLGRGVVGRRTGLPATAPPGGRDLPRLAARALGQPADPPPAGPDRRRRLAEGPGPGAAGPAGRLGPTAGSPSGATRVLAAWTLHLRGLGAPVTDPAADALVESVRDVDLPAAVRLVLDRLGVDDPRVLEHVVAQARAMVETG